MSPLDTVKSFYDALGRGDVVAVVRAATRA